MKKVYFLAVLLFVICQFQVKSQSEIWGVTPSGANGFGSIFGMPTGSTGIANQYNFQGYPGSGPQQTRLLQASNGKFYGVTYTGGLNNLGVLFEYDATLNTYTVKWDFVASSGSNPQGPLMQASNGKIYGMTFAGGTNGLGVIFEYDVTSGTYTKKVDLSSANGSQPYGALVELSTSNGKLYGLTSAGGTNGLGVIFDYDLSTGVYSKKVDLTATLGSFPNGEFVQVGTMLYGLCTTDGANGDGTVIEYDYTNNICTKKIDIVNANGSNPFGSFLKASDGNLYAMANAGGTNGLGVIFKYNVGTNTYTKLFDLTLALGWDVYGSLVQSSVNGKLYGITRAGGTSGQGVIFEFDYTSNTYTKKFDLVSNASIGGTSYTGIIFGSNGKLYGSLTSGGLANAGVIFEYDLSTSTYTKKIDLNYGVNGASAYGGMVYASNAKLYGTTLSGGANNAGVIFEYDKSTSTYTKKIDLLSSTGASAYGPMVEASNGKLYGLTNTGGTNNVGVLYEYNYSSNTYTKKIDLSATLGSGPFGGMVQAANGKLYGLTRLGGTSNVGALFEYDYTTNTYTKKNQFYRGGEWSKP